MARSRQFPVRGAGALLAAALLVAAGGCSQEQLPEQSLVIENHVFTPTEIRMAAGQKIRLRIENRDDASEEFDSDSLGREKVVPGKATGYVVIGPLAAGRYPFMGEFHSQTAQGAVVVQ
ncbi:MAG: cupredoxin domain-containing protein [Nevskia sp.]|nr:cupredoxin domain-containing protein [Nevskia sp.]